MLAEASDTASAITTFADIAVASGLKKYKIVDRLGTVLVPVSDVIDQASGRPNGSHGWPAYRRVGADLDPRAFRIPKPRNDLAGRIAEVSTGSRGGLAPRRRPGLA